MSRKITLQQVPSRVDMALCILEPMIMIRSLDQSFRRVVETVSTHSGRIWLDIKSQESVEDRINFTARSISLVSDNEGKHRGQEFRGFFYYGTDPRISRGELEILV